MIVRREGFLGASFLLAAGCASAPPSASPPPVVIAPAAPDSAAPTVTAAPAPLPPPGRRFVMESQPIVDDLDADTGPAPCDFARTYRGKIGETLVTLSLASPAPDRLGGLAHYDRPGTALPLTGTRAGAVGFTLREKGGGRFEGKCDEKGALTGTYVLGTKRQPFTLAARPASWPPLYRVAREARFEPHHPRCANEGKPNAPVELDGEEGRIVCLPNNPKARKELLAGAPNLYCTANDHGYRVFGLPDAAVEKQVNAHLEAGFFEIAKRELKGCHGTHTWYRSVSLVAARPDLLIVAGFRSEDFGGAHPMNNAEQADAIDLTRGVAIRLEDLVDPARLRETARTCLPFYRALAEKKEVVLDRLPPPSGCDDEPSMGMILWDCDQDGLRSPEWSLLPEGIVLGMWANPHATAAYDGKGPVIPWSVLLREKAIPASSPVARLWAGATPAAPDTPACPLAYWGDHLDVWREAPQH